MRPELVRKNPSGGGRLAKRPPIVQQLGPSFPGLWATCETAKSRWIPAASQHRRTFRPERSEPFADAPTRPIVLIKAVAVETAVARSVVAVKTALHHAMAEA